MTRICPQCSQENLDSTIFCTRCGFRFSPSMIGNNTPVNNYGPPAQPAATPEAAPAWQIPAGTATPGTAGGQSTFVPEATPQWQFSSGGMPAADAAGMQQPSTPYQPQGAYQQPQGAGQGAYQQPQQSLPPQGAAQGAYQQPQGAEQGAYQGMYASPPPMAAYGSPGGDPYGAPGAAYGAQPQQMAYPGGPQGGQYPPGPAYAPQSAQPGIQERVRRAFAGKGTPVTHASWLLDGKQVSPADIRTALIEKVQQRFPNEVKTSLEHLAERDAVVEERDYVKIEHAPASIFVYVTSFGQDLYISRTTTVQPALSPARIAFFGALFLLMLISFITSAINPYASFFSATLLLFFIIAGLHSVVLGLTEKDFLSYLRPNILNDFRVDDGAILEHIADKGIYEAVESLKLDSGPFLLPTRTYPMRQPLRFF